MRTHSLTDRELADFFRSLSVLFHAGVSTADSLYLLAQEESGHKREWLTALGRCLDEGAVLSEALQEAEVFPKHASGMIRVGERTGRLEEALEGLAGFYEERDRLSRLLRSALAYPGLILVLVLTVVAVLLMEVLPVFDGVYGSLGTQLTGLAAGLMYAGQCLKRALPALGCLLAVIAAAAALVLWVPAWKLKAQRGFQKRFADRGLLRRFNNARFARVLAMGLGSGLALHEAVELAGALLADAPGAAARIQRCAKLLEEGNSLPEAMEKTQLLPPSASRLLAVGIRGGNGDKVMEGIADRLQDEATEAVERAVSRIEPAMVLVTSVLVGVILLSVMLPLMDIMWAIG